MALVSITGTLKDLTGTVMPDTIITFVRSGVAAQDGATVIPKEASTVSDANGNIALNLFPGNYTAATSAVAGLKAPSYFNVAVPEAASAVLSDMIDAAPTTVTPSAVLQAQAARDAAIAAAATAVSAAGAENVSIFDTEAILIASTSFVVGSRASTRGTTAVGDGGAQDWQIVAAGTYTASATVLNLTGIAGQAVSLKTEFAETSDLLADTRPLALFTVGQKFTVNDSIYLVAASGASDNQLVTAGSVKLYDLQVRTVQTFDYYVATLQNGDAFGPIGGYFYQLNSAATGTASATNDLGVDGVEAQGTIYAAHYGMASDATSDITSKLTNALASTSSRFVIMPAGDYRVDGTASVPTWKTLQIDGNLQRYSASSANKSPVLIVDNTQLSLITGRGSVITQNESPDGIICIGPEDPTNILNQTINTQWNSIESLSISGMGFVSATTVAITAATQANPCSVTAVSHGYTTGDRREINDVLGMTELNGRTLTITVVDPNTFTLDGVDSTAYTAYTSGGTVAKPSNKGIVIQCTAGQHHPSGKVCYDNWIRNVEIHSVDDGIYIAAQANANNIISPQMWNIGRYGVNLNGRDAGGASYPDPASVTGIVLSGLGISNSFTLTASVAFQNASFNTSGLLGGEPGAGRLATLDINSQSNQVMGTENHPSAITDLGSNNQILTNATIDLAAPKVVAYLGATLNGVTGNGTQYLINFGATAAEDSWPGGTYSNGVFTAPYDALWEFSGTLYMNGLNLVHADFHIELVTSSGTHTIWREIRNASTNQITTLIKDYGFKKRLSVGQTAQLRLTVGAGGQPGTVSIFGDGTSLSSLMVTQAL